MEWHGMNPCQTKVAQNPSDSRRELSSVISRCNASKSNEKTTGTHGMSLLIATDTRWCPLPITHTVVSSTARPGSVSGNSETSPHTQTHTGTSNDSHTESIKASLHSSYLASHRVCHVSGE